MVCNLAENAIKKKWGQVDKKAFVVRVLNTLFAYNVVEKTQVEDIKEFYIVIIRLIKWRILKKCMLVVKIGFKKKFCDDNELYYKKFHSIFNL